MKKIIGLVAISLISVAAFTQNTALDKHFSSYQNDENFTKVNVSGKMFDLAAFLETDDEDIQEFKDFASGVEGMKMLIGHDIGDGFGKYKKALSKIDNQFEELMSVDDKEGKVTFFIDERNGIVEEFLVIGAADSTLCLISVIGQLDLKKLGSMTKKMQTEGFDYIGKLDENGASSIKIYPNPTNKGNDVTLEIPEDLNGAAITVYDVTGKVVKNEIASGTSMTLGLNDLRSGQYVVEFMKNETSIKKKVFIN